jgi:fluoride ion exporter CrcB/FEX
MENNFMPKTRLGKWSVWLNAFFVIVIIISVNLVSVLGVLSYDDHWWDVTVPILALTTITAFILGTIAIIKNKESSALVYISVTIGLLAILFIPLHSLFIND